MSDDWDRILETFKPPWKIKHHTSGNYWIEDKEGRVLLCVYVEAEMSEPTISESTKNRAASNAGFYSES